jgi:hypothetical protein
VKKFLPVLVSIISVLLSLLLAEVGLRLLSPHFRLSYTEARFSARYHHGSQEMMTFFKRIQTNPKAFKGDLTVAVLGDSFVAGEEVAAPRRFTSVLQCSYDISTGGRVKIINLGVPSYSTMLYERLYRDIVLPLDPDVVIVCLDQTDAADDNAYEQDLSSGEALAATGVPEADFACTILKNYESYPVTFFLLRNSQLFLRAHVAKRRLTGSGFIPESTRADSRVEKKMERYLETCKDPAPFRALFDNSEKYIRAISLMKPPRQKLYFVTYPRAENLAGQHKTSLIRGALPDSYSSDPFFEYWINQENLAGRYLNIKFIHTSGSFRAAIAATGLQYYFYNNDVHWNELGHGLFAEILDKEIVRTLYQGRRKSGAGQDNQQAAGH